MGFRRFREDELGFGVWEDLFAARGARVEVLHVPPLL